MMALMVLDPQIEEELKAQREASGLDRYDEVWEGVYMMAPLANNEHTGVQQRLATALQNALGMESDAFVSAGSNVSDRNEGWRDNYRIPDAVVVFPGGAARNCDTHWCGGPDFVAEVTSPGDRTRDKLEFYGGIGVRELLVIDRKPWLLELYRLADGDLRLVGRSSLADPQPLRGEVVPTSFRLVPGDGRPRIEVTHHDGVQRWLV
jgi:Uma2 family endonuclease